MRSGLFGEILVVWKFLLSLLINQHVSSKSNAFKGSVCTEISHYLLMAFDANGTYVSSIAYCRVIDAKLTRIDLKALT